MTKMKVLVQYTKCSKMFGSFYMFFVCLFFFVAVCFLYEMFRNGKIYWQKEPKLGFSDEVECNGLGLVVGRTKIGVVEYKQATRQDRIG